MCMCVCAYVCPRLSGQISRKRKELEEKLLWGANRKVVGGLSIGDLPDDVT